MFDFSKLGIQKKLFVSFGGLILACLLVLAVISYEVSKNATIEMISHDLLTQLDSTVETIKVAYGGAIHVQEKNMKVAESFVAGRVRLESSQMITVPIENQATNEKKEISIPNLMIDGVPQYKNSDFIKRISNLTDTTVTIFQMIPGGMLRVASNIKKKDGTLAIGTYIPETSPVYKKIANGEVFFGRAFVVDDWYITAYAPLRDNGKVVGAIYTGVLEKNTSLVDIQKELKAKKVLNNGYFYIINSKGDMLLHSSLEGKNILDLKDAHGIEFIKKMVEQKNGSISYHFASEHNSSAQKKMSFFKNYPEFDWIVAISVDYSEFLSNASELRNKMILIGLVLLGLALWLVSALGRSFAKPLLALCDELNSNSIQMDSTSKKVHDISQNLAASVNQQASATQQSVAALNEMSSMLAQTTASSGETEKLAGEIKAMSASGDNAMKELADSMDQINDMNHQLAAMVEIIRSISEKTKVINDIVFKTQLLSFNASIEAARAGQYGQGFAVVAEEIGSLALMSGKASNEITTLLEESETKVQLTVQDSKKVITETESASSQAVEIFGHISSKIDDIFVKVQSIVSASKEQQAGIAQSHDAMKQLDEAAHGNQQAAGSSADYARSLSVMSADLSSRVLELKKFISGQQS